MLNRGFHAQFNKANTLCISIIYQELLPLNVGWEQLDEWPLRGVLRTMNRNSKVVQMSCMTSGTNYFEAKN